MKLQSTQLVLVLVLVLQFWSWSPSSRNVRLVVRGQSEKVKEEPRKKNNEQRLEKTKTKRRWAE